MTRQRPSEPIAGSRPLAPLTRSAIQACARCGITRHVHTGRGTLCRSCTDVLTPAERTAWAA
jgi:hypothetical protein